MLIRYILEKCKTTKDAINKIHFLPIASAQTITLADKSGEIVVVECNPENVVVVRPKRGQQFIATANNFKHGEHDTYMTFREILALAAKHIPGAKVRRKLF